MGGVILDKQKKKQEKQFIMDSVWGVEMDLFRFLNKNEKIISSESHLHEHANNFHRARSCPVHQGRLSL